MGSQVNAYSKPLPMNQPLLVGLGSQAHPNWPSARDRKIVIHAIKAGLCVTAIEVGEETRCDQHAGATTDRPRGGFSLTSG